MGPQQCLRATRRMPRKHPEHPTLFFGQFRHFESPPNRLRSGGLTLHLSGKVGDSNGAERGETGCSKLPLPNGCEEATALPSQAIEAEVTRPSLAQAPANGTSAQGVSSDRLAPDNAGSSKATLLAERASRCRGAKAEAGSAAGAAKRGNLLNALEPGAMNDGAAERQTWGPRVSGLGRKHLRNEPNFFDMQRPRSAGGEAVIHVASPCSSRYREKPWAGQA
jgi:hypothetical protein